MDRESEGNSWSSYWNKNSMFHSNSNVWNQCFEKCSQVPLWSVQNTVRTDWCCLPPEGERQRPTATPAMYLAVPANAPFSPLKPCSPPSPFSCDSLSETTTSFFWEYFYIVTHTRNFLRNVEDGSYRPVWAVIVRFFKFKYGSTELVNPKLFPTYRFHRFVN